MTVSLPQGELEALEKAFHLMWGSFPEAVQLTYKDREIVALNDACIAYGRWKGMKCSTHGAPEGHRSCLAGQAMRTQQPVSTKFKLREREISTYWLPVDGYPDFFIHFSIGMSSGSEQEME